MKVETVGEPNARCHLATNSASRMLRMDDSSEGEGAEGVEGLGEGWDAEGVRLR